jgi:hypothetical protein
MRYNRVQTMEEPMSTDRLPRTDSIQELARFWDTHDLTDFEDDLEEVAGPVFDREKVVTIHLDAKEAETLEHIAESQGLDSAALIREWVIEKMQAT